MAGQGRYSIFFSINTGKRPCQISFSFYLCNNVRRIVLILCLLAFAFGAAAQGTDSLRLGFIVRGQVVDAGSGSPMESVTVTIPGRHYATVTNADGRFVVKSDREIARVEFSFLGYKKRAVAAHDGMKVRLQRENLLLEEASIISGDPRSIVDYAVDNLWDTYCTEPELLECFYRETVQKRNRYTYVAEAVARLYKASYDGSVSWDAAALEKSRVLMSQRRQDTLSVKTQGGPTMALSLDFAKNNALLFNREDMELYSYHMELPSYINDRLQFVIRMEPEGEAPYALYHVKLYIDREWLCFTRIEASLDMQDKAKATQMLLVRKPFSLRFFPEESTLVVNYRVEDGKARLGYFRSTLRFACDWRKRLFKTRYTAVNELVVTDLRPEAVPIERKDRFRTSDILDDKAPEFLDPDFWLDYNIIEPSESLEHAIHRLRKN